jgi:hypothetical protein
MAKGTVIDRNVQYVQKHLAEKMALCALAGCWKNYS